MQTDAEIVDAVLKGEKELFAELVRRYEKAVRAVALDVSGDYHLAGDIAQDAFIKAYENLASLRTPEAFGPWLLKIAKRIAFEQAKQIVKGNSPEIKLSEVVEKPNGQLDDEKNALPSVG